MFEDLINAFEALFSLMRLGYCIQECKMLKRFNPLSLLRKCVRMSCFAVMLAS
jgi:hypothetical protein